MDEPIVISSDSEEDVPNAGQVPTRQRETLRERMANRQENFHTERRDLIGRAFIMNFALRYIRVMPVKGRRYIELFLALKTILCFFLLGYCTSCLPSYDRLGRKFFITVKIYTKNLAAICKYLSQLD